MGKYANITMVDDGLFFVNENITDLSKNKIKSKTVRVIHHVNLFKHKKSLQLFP